MLFECAKVSADAMCMPMLLNAGGWQLQAQVAAEDLTAASWALHLQTGLQVTTFCQSPKLRAPLTI